MARVAADRAEVARAEERRHVIPPVGDELHPEPRETRTLLHEGGVDAALVPLEHRRIVDDLARLAVDDFVHVHGLGEIAADVEELQAEGESRIRPERVVAAEPDGLILIVTQFSHRRRKRVLRRLKGVAGEPMRLALEPRKVECLRRGGRGRGALLCGGVRAGGAQELSARESQSQSQ